MKRKLLFSVIGTVALASVILLSVFAISKPDKKEIPKNELDSAEIVEHTTQTAKNEAESVPVKETESEETNSKESSKTEQSASLSKSTSSKQSAKSETTKLISSEAETLLENDYKLDKDLTIQDVTYNLQYKSTEKRSGGQLSDSHCYETTSGERAKYDIKTGKLISFFKYNDNQKSEKSISKDEALLIAENFLKTQCDISLYKRDCCEYNEQREQFSIKYSRMHLGHLVESMSIWISDNGEILSYSGNYDTENIIFSVKEVNEDKAREAMVKLLDNPDFDLPSEYSWTISDNNKPAIEIIIANNSGWNIYGIEIYQDIPYIAYSKYAIQSD